MCAGVPTHAAGEVHLHAEDADVGGTSVGGHCENWIGLEGVDGECGERFFFLTELDWEMRELLVRDVFIPESTDNLPWYETGVNFCSVVRLSPSSPLAPSRSPNLLLTTPTPFPPPLFFSYSCHVPRAPNRVSHFRCKRGNNEQTNKISTHSKLAYPVRRPDVSNSELATSSLEPSSDQGALWHQ